MSKLRKELTAKKRQNIQNSILNQMLLYAKLHKELKVRDVFTYGDSIVNQMIKHKPQDKTLIISSALNLRKHIENYFLLNAKGNEP